MSFTYGGQDTTSMPGVTAVLQTWPSLGGLTLDTDTIPGRNGIVYNGATQATTEFVFDVELSAPNVTTLFARRDALAGLLDPAKGPRDLVVEDEPGWVWHDVLASKGIDWERTAWRYGPDLKLAGTVTFSTTSEPAAREVSPQAVAVSGPTSFTLDRGNTSSVPRIEFPSGGDITVSIGDFVLQLSGTPSGGTAVLDWESYEFYVRDASGARVSSLVACMDRYDAPALRVGEPVTVNVGRSSVVTYEWTGPVNGSTSVMKRDGVVMRTNLFTNPSFEAGLASPGWTVRADSQASAELDTSWAAAGSQSVKLTPSGTGKGSSGCLYISDQSAPMLAAGKTYTVAGKIRLAAPQTGTLHAAARSITIGLHNNDTNANSYTWSIGERAANASGETRLVTTVEIPADSSGFVRLFNGAVDASNLVWWDAVTIEEGATDGSYFDGSTPGYTEAGAPLAATLYPNARRI